MMTCCTFGCVAVVCWTGFIGDLPRELPTTRQEQWGYLDAYSRVRGEEIEKWLKVAKTGFTERGKHRAGATAVLILGELRATEAVPLLVDNLVFNPDLVDGIVVQAPSLRSARPCAYALVQIGAASFGALLDKIESTDDEKIRLTGAVVFVRVLGIDYAKIYLEERVRKLNDKRKQARVRAMMDKLVEVKDIN